MAVPTIITHGLVGLALAVKVRGIHVASRRRLLIACAFCTILPDFDYLGFKLGVQYNSLFGHRGFTHSIFFAVVLALVVAWLFNRRVQGGLANYAKLAALLFFATFSHNLLDAMTDGGEGVAFFSPFSNHRYFFPYRPIMVSPLGLEAFFGWRGAVVLLNEFLLVIAPLGILLFWREIWKMAKTKRLVAAAAAGAWAVLVMIFTGLYPLNNIGMTINNSEFPVIDLYNKQYDRLDLLQRIPVEGIPDGKIVKNFEEFKNLGLFNRRLEAADADKHWASGFFPNWFGGLAGRWQDPNFTLFIRTLFGYGVPGSQEILEVLKESIYSPAKQDYLFRLSPAEKYDLASGDYSFLGTRSVLAITHNAVEWPRYWYGICNGMAAAANSYEEPYRSVEVINPNGFKIRFHPNDVKALLGYAMYTVAEWSEIGTPCNVNGPEAKACRINPGAFFLATMNRIGLARDGFVVNGFSGTRKQFYLFDAARVDLLEEPRPVAGVQGWALPTPVKYLAWVRFTMDFVSTILGDKDGGVPEDTALGNGYYKKVGRVVVPRVLDAMIALNQDMDVVGGAWLGDEDVPDIIGFYGREPGLENKDRLKTNNAFKWSIIKWIYAESINGAKDRKPIDLSL
jgi:inner membrane protein